MKNSKLIALLQSLELQDLKQLESYLNSPFFIEEKAKDLHTIAVKLFFLLTKDDLNIEQLTKENIFIQLYPNVFFTLNKINRVIVYLVKKIEHFIIYQSENEAVYENILRQKQTLLSFYVKKNLHKWYVMQKRSIQKIQMTTQRRDIKYYLNEFLTVCKYTEIDSLNTNRKNVIKFDYIIGLLNSFYSLSLLTIACLVKSRIILEKKDVKIIDDSLLQIGDFREGQDIEPVINIYECALQLIEGKGNDEIYQYYKELLMRYHTCFELRNLKTLFTYALNYCITQINAGREYYKECWNLYGLGLEMGVLYINGQISPSSLKNIITLSLRLKKYKWAKDFLHQHKNKIQSENPTEVYSFNLANVFFHQQKHDKVYKILRTLKCRDMFYELAMRRLEIKVLYEEEEIEVLYSKLNAYRVFIHRNDFLNKDSAEMNNNFLNVIYKLINVIPKDEKQINHLTKIIKQKKKLAERKWITAKLEGLKGKRAFTKVKVFEKNSPQNQDSL